MLFLMQTLTHLLVLALVVSTMLGVGLMLTVRDIYVSLHDRRWLVRALLANFVVLPAIALLAVSPAGRAQMFRKCCASAGIAA